MRIIPATLPAIGNINIEFHNESLKVLDFIGPKEFNRLASIPHLGVASSAFTGVSHSRLEYLLLQCAIIELISTFYKDVEFFALSGKVILNGRVKSISSGSELLRCWSMLSNYGHAQYTFGVERTLLQFARIDPSFKSWLTGRYHHTDVRRWSRSIIEHYRDYDMHLLLAFYRVHEGPTYDRTKSLCMHCLRNFVLPPEILFPSDISSRYKITRLRSVFQLVRKLSIITLDSYYSHNPIRFQLDTAIHDLKNQTTSLGVKTDFELLLDQYAGWLADELWLHPNATAAQREYEIRNLPKLQQYYSQMKTYPENTKGIMNNILFGGFGMPKEGRYKPLLRLSIKKPHIFFQDFNDSFELLTRLEHSLANPPLTQITVDRNPHTDTVHIDVIYRNYGVNISAIANVYSKIYPWVIRLLETDAVSTVRRFPPSSSRTTELLRRLINSKIDDSVNILASLFNSLIQYLLPVNYIWELTEYLPRSRGERPYRLRMKDSNGHVYDRILPFIERQVQDNPLSLPHSRLQELKAVKRCIQRNKSELLLACLESIIIRDEHEKPVDQWDGVIMYTSNNMVTITIIEAKDYRLKSTNENEAIKQLQATKDLFTHNYGIKYRIEKIRGLGGRLRLLLYT